MLADGAEIESFSSSQGVQGLVSKASSEHMIDWQFLSLNYREQNESNFSPKVSDMSRN